MLFNLFHYKESEGMLNMKSALVVIDVQNYFVNKYAQSLPKKIANYIKANSKRFDYVLFTKFVNKPKSNFFRLLNWKQCRRSPDTDIHKLLLEFSNSRNTFEKSTFSIFGSVKFVKFVTQNNIKSLSLCGTDTECCVYASAMDAFDRGLDVKVLPNLCGSSHGNAAHETGIKLMKQNMKNCLETRPV